MKNFHRPILTALLLAVACSSALATSMIPADLVDLVTYADKAFTGKVVTVEAEKTSQGWADKITFSVTEPIVGTEQPGDTVTWYQARHAEQVPIPGMPKFAAGEEHVIFLSAKAVGSNFQSPVALGQGSFRVHRDTSTGEAYARNEFQNASLFQNVNMDALSDIMLESNPATRSFNNQERATEKQSIAGKLGTLRSGAIDLKTLKEAAKAIKSRGKNTSTLRSGNAATTSTLQPVKITR